MGPLELLQRLRDERTFKRGTETGERDSGGEMEGQKRTEGKKPVRRKRMSASLGRVFKFRSKKLMNGLRREMGERKE